MNLLYIAHRIPYPPNKGEKIRSFHQIRYLSRRHTVHLACMVDERDDLRHVETLEKYCASVATVYRHKTPARCLAALALFTDKPLSVASFYSRQLEKKIAVRLRSEKLDAIFVSSSAMAEYVRHVSGIPKIIDFMDVDSEKWRLCADFQPFPFSWIYRVEAERLSRYEEELARAFDRSIFASQKEASLLQQRVKDRPISAIPNGVDLDYFAPNEDDPSCSNQPSIVFTGTMDYLPNVDAARYFCGGIFPLVREALPQVRFDIVGRNPARLVRVLGRQTNVTVTGSVADVRPYLARASVAVAPLRIARGVQNKILEAMAMGVPVVGTSDAFQGVGARLADGIRIADEPKEFAQEVLTLLEDEELHRRCSLQARRYVERCHQWRDHGTLLDHLLQEMGSCSLENQPHSG